MLNNSYRAVFPRPIPRYFYASFLLLSLILFLGFTLQAEAEAALSQVTLSWRANAEPDLSGYRIYYGTESGNYTQVMGVGKTTSAVISGLTVGRTYYFAVTAFNSRGFEGEYSNEISKTIGQTNNTLNTLKSGTGTGTIAGAGIDCGGTCQKQYAPGTSVTLTATPNANSSFGGWSGGGCIGAGSCTVTMNSNRTVIATFNLGMNPGPTTYKITASASTGGTVNPSGVVTVTPGSRPSFSFTAQPGYYVSDVKVDGISQGGGLNSYIFPDVQADHRLEVVFSRVESNQFTLALSKTGNGEGMVIHNPAGTVYNTGTVVNLKAEAAEGSVFTGWSGACTGISPSCTVIMGENRSVTAGFKATSGKGSSRTYAENFKLDFNGDGQTDILWHHQSRGEVYVWYMAGAQFVRDEHVRTVGDDLNWKVAGVGDFNGDGKPDILWHHQGRGDVYVWYMNGKEFIRDQYIRTVEDTNWKIVGIGDFNGDGQPDILWHHQSRGDVYVWYMDGATFLSDQYIRTVGEDLNWKIAGVADFNGDGKPDILWQHEARGEVYVWFMDGATFAGDRHVQTVADDLNWKVEGLGDYNGDGKVDILWRHQTRGDVYVWFMDGATFVRDQYIRSVNRVFDDLDWKIVN